MSGTENKESGTRLPRRKAIHVQLRMSAPSNPCLTRFGVSVWPDTEAGGHGTPHRSTLGLRYNEVLPVRNALLTRTFSFLPECVLPIFN